MRIYNSDQWVYKMGIVGFDRIIQFNFENYGLDKEDYGYKIEDDYIEFDVGLLNELPKAFFQYFYHEYDVAENINYKFNYLLNRASKESNFKNSINEIKKLIKDKNARIQKLQLDNFNEFDEIYNDVCNIKFSELEELKEGLEKYVILFRDDKVNYPQALNLFKSVLQTSFFGQNSFLNVCNNSKSIEEQQYIMFKDYVKPVIQSEKLTKIKEDMNEGELKQYIDNNMDSSKQATEVDKYMKDICKNLWGKKRKFESLSIMDGTYNKCCLCDENLSYGSDYSDGNFIPLAISNDGCKNLFWDMNSKFPICPLCRLILLCTAAGTTKVYKNYLESNYSFNDKLYYGFISMEGNLGDLIKENNTFKNLSSKDISFEEWLYDSLIQERKISKWQLQNVLYVEFNADYRSKNSRMNYYNIPNYIASFLCNKDADILQEIKSSTERMRIFDWIMGRKDLNILIDRELRKKIKNEFVGTNIINVVKLKNILESYKAEGGYSKVNDAGLQTIDWLYKDGIMIAKIYHDNKMENKLSGISYRLLNSIKAGNKNEFMDSILRIYLSVDLPVPKNMLESIREEKLSFSQVGHSFLTGLNGYYKKEKEGAISE